LVERSLKLELIGHISRDATAIEGREKPAKKLSKQKPPLRKSGRRAKGEQPEPREERRLNRQVHQSAQKALRELPEVCDVGVKNNFKRIQATVLLGDWFFAFQENKLDPTKNHFEPYVPL